MMVHAWLVTNAAVRGAAAQETARRHGGPAWDSSGTAAFRADVFNLVNAVLLALLGLAALALLVALVESAVARRRTVAALVAAGTPRAVLARAQCWQVLIPTVPGTTLAALADLLAVRSFTGTATGGWDDVTLVFAVPMPWAETGALARGRTPADPRRRWGRHLLVCR
ncbi:hypothetical protein [Dactylosporangium matsuzakiense]|uniref:FtsX-like permease family protein n=1 Tax=Dactylosporangium matsuzakiense TaxID=53360 RepID=A0A9W6NQP3_9ACTN|nr:hypothetical protein [Dactylosporangium matsuzakiense]UWZ48402.1 hypothetical protein Dmats_19520 [Dactylosporangium matsuzakiense]GLL05441.1 hypothetical protein GCM10017581_071880 [Dactylosporangium matsuzakiense]